MQLPRSGNSAWGATSWDGWGTNHQVFGLVPCLTGSYFYYCIVKWNTAWMCSKASAWMQSAHFACSSEESALYLRASSVLAILARASSVPYCVPRRAVKCMQIWKGEAHDVQTHHQSTDRDISSPELGSRSDATIYSNESITVKGIGIFISHYCKASAHLNVPKSSWSRPLHKQSWLAIVIKLYKAHLYYAVSKAKLSEEHEKYPFYPL